MVWLRLLKRRRKEYYMHMTYELIKAYEV